MYNMYTIYTLIGIYSIHVYIHIYPLKGIYVYIVRPMIYTYTPIGSYIHHWLLLGERERSEREPVQG